MLYLALARVREAGRLNSTPSILCLERRQGELGKNMQKHSLYKQGLVCVGGEAQGLSQRHLRKGELS